jgi:hypothetical protein
MPDQRITRPDVDAVAVDPSRTHHEHAAHVDTDSSESVSWRENALGNSQQGRVSNVSWGAIFAGVVTFLGILLLFSLLSAATGLAGSGVGTAIVGIVGVLLAFFSGGAVAGILSVRSGLIHGFLTWAASLLATVLLLVALTLGAAGAVGGVLGSLVSGLGAAVGPSLSQVDPSDVPTPTASQTQAAQDATQQAQKAASTAADATRTGSIFGFIGLLLGALVASIAGLLGSRSVNNRRARTERRTTRA